MMNTSNVRPEESINLELNNINSTNDFFEQQHLPKQLGEFNTFDSQNGNSTFCNINRCEDYCDTNINPSDVKLNDSNSEDYLNIKNNQTSNMTPVVPDSTTYFQCPLQSRAHSQLYNNISPNLTFQPPSLVMLQYSYDYPVGIGNRNVAPTTGCYQANAWYPNNKHNYYTEQPVKPYPYHYKNLHYPAKEDNGQLFKNIHQYQLQMSDQYNIHHDQLADILQLSNSGREARNRAEKNRRDKLNGSIQELSTMVPHVAESPRRVDKTAVLRFSAHGLRVNYVFGNVVKKPPPAKIQVADTLTRMLDSFHLSITCHGQIVLVSSSIEQHLGHCQTDLYGQNIMNITHPDDQALLRRQLIPTDLENLFDIQPEDESGELRARTQEEEDRIDERLKADIKVFVVRLARAGPRSEPTTYEAIRFNGSFRRADLAPRGAKSNNFPSGLQLIRRTRGRDDNIPLHSISGNDIVFVAMAQVLRPPNLNGRLMEANALEYRTRHLIDGRIIDCDQRIGIVAGYMKHEVTGLSPFTFMHQDDARWVIVALRQMYDSKSDYGESCYRLITRNNRFVYLQTKGFLEIDAETNKVHSFVCVNKLVSDEEGRRLVQEMKNKFSLIIDTKIPISSPLDIPASENPQQLEKAVLCLIQNLPKAGEDDENDPSTTNTRPIIEEKTVNTPVKNVALKATTDCMKRSPRTTPLALIAPEPSTVKSSIIKSVDVVGKNIRSGRMISSPQSVGANSPISPALSRDENSNDSTGTNCSFSHSRSSTFQRSCSNTTEGSPVQIKEEFFHSPQSRVPPLSHGNCKCFYEVSSPTSNCPNCQEFNSVASPSQSIKSPSTSSSKRPYPSNSAISSFESDPELIEESAKRKFIYREAAEREVHEIISHSFQQIEHPQRSVPNVSSKPREQCNRFFVPSTTEQLNEIFDELRDEEESLTNRTDPGMLVNSPVIEQNPTHPPDDHLSQKNDLKPR